jgi:hypothetical protein
MPVIIGADLNSLRGFSDAAFKAIDAHLPVAYCGRGRTHRWLPFRLDFMFSTVTGAKSCETLPGAYGSDHRPLLMTIGS